MDIEVYGNYICLEQIGKGGMAKVFLAKNRGALNLFKFFALKRMKHTSLVEGNSYLFFEQEAKISLMIDHPNVIHTYEFGRGGDDEFYLVMEYVAGRSLWDLFSRLYEQGQRLPLNHVLYIFESIANGLSYIHDFRNPVTGEKLSITHRDLSPQNVMIGFGGQIKIIDFGVALAPNTAGHDQTWIVGKAAYMSPEQISGEELDHRSDIFAFGVMLWEVLAGQRLFAGRDRQETYARIKNHPIPDIRDLRKDIPSEIGTLINYCLKRSRDERYQTIVDVLDDLRAITNQLNLDHREKHFEAYVRNVFTEELTELHERLKQFATVSYQGEEDTIVTQSVARSPDFISSVICPDADEDCVFIEGANQDRGPLQDEPTFVAKAPQLFSEETVRAKRSNSLEEFSKKDSIKVIPAPHLPMKIEIDQQELQPKSRIPSKRARRRRISKMMTFITEALAAPLYFAGGFLLTHFTMKMVLPRSELLMRLKAYLTDFL